MTSFTFRLLLAGALSALTFVGALALGIKESIPSYPPLPLRTADTGMVTRALAHAIATELGVPASDSLPSRLAAYADAKRRALTARSGHRRTEAIADADRVLATIAGKDPTSQEIARIDAILGLPLIR